MLLHTQSEQYSLNITFIWTGKGSGLEPNPQYLRGLPLFLVPGMAGRQGVKNFPKLKDKIIFLIKCW